MKHDPTPFDNVTLAALAARVATIPLADWNAVASLILTLASILYIAVRTVQAINNNPKKKEPDHEIV
jgi:hypothetical protein